MLFIVGPGPKIDAPFSFNHEKAEHQESGTQSGVGLFRSLYNTRMRRAAPQKKRTLLHHLVVA